MSLTAHISKNITECHIVELIIKQDIPSTETRNHGIGGALQHSSVRKSLLRHLTIYDMPM